MTATTHLPTLLVQIPVWDGEQILLQTFQIIQISLIKWA